MKIRRMKYNRFFVGELYDLGYVEDAGFVTAENMGLLEMG
jgi:hypothetical protein